MKAKKKKKHVHFTIPKAKQTFYGDDFRDFDDEFRPALYKVFLMKSRNPDTADELSQRALIKFWSWKTGCEDFTWTNVSAALARSCSFVYLDFINESKKALENTFCADDLLEFDVPDNGLSDPYRVLVGNRTGLAVNRFANLLREDRDFFLDAIFNGLSHQELAKKYNKTVGSSGVDLCRYKGEFQEFMQTFDAFPEEEEVYAKIRSRVH